MQARQMWVRVYAAVAAVMMLTLLVSYLGAAYAGRVMAAEEVGQLRTESAIAAQQIETGLQNAQHLVAAIAALGWPGRRTWREQAEAIRSRHGDAGLINVLFVRFVPASARGEYERSLQADSDLPPGANPTFSIFPAGERDGYYVLHDRVPWTGTIMHMAYDFGAEPGRTALFEQVRDTGVPAATDRSTDSQRSTGFVMVVPVYDRNLPAGTPAERRTAFIGFAMGIVATRTLVEGSLQGERLSHVSFELEEIAAGGPFLAFDSHANHAARDPAAAKHMQHDQQIEFAGRTWHLHTALLPSQADSLRRSVERIILVGGLLAGIIISIGVVYLFITRSRTRQQMEQMHQELRDSRERFADSFGASGVGMVMFALEGTVVQANPAYCEMLGYSEEELRELTYIDLTHPDDVAESIWLRDQLRENDMPFIRVAKRYIRKDGEIVWSNSTFTRAHQTGSMNPFVIAHVENLTPRRKAEEKAQTQERLYRLLAENTTDLVTLFTATGECLYVSPSCLAILGYTQAEAMAMNLLTTAHEDDRAAVLQVCAQLRAGISPQVTYRQQRKSGEYIWFESGFRPVFDEAGELIHIQGCSRDITQRKHAEEQAVHYAAQVERRHRELESVVRFMIEGVVAVDESKRLLLMNLSAGRLLTIEQSPVGAPLAALGLPALLQDALERRAEGRGEDERIMVRVGQVDVAASVTTVVTSDGNVLGAVALMQDITAQMQVERLRDGFVASASHELRGPLATLSAVVEAMRDGLIPADALRRYQDSAIAEIQRLRRLTDDMMLMSRLKAGLDQINVGEFQLPALLQEIAERWALRCAAVNITLTVASPELWVKTDCDRVEQVLAAFLDNAIRFSPDGGTVRLFAQVEGDGVRIGVADTGVGIPPDDLLLVWERFYKVDRARTRHEGGGSGLGLSIVREVVTRLNGSVHVESDLGRGSVFSFYLPGALIPEPARTSGAPA